MWAPASVLALLLALTVPWPAHAATYTAATCNNKSGETSVQDKIDLTSAGDTVVVPAGSGCEWSSQVTLPTAHHITLTGSGSITTGVSCGTDTNGAAIAGTCGAATSGGTTIAVVSTNYHVAAFEVPTGNNIITNLTFERAVGSCEATTWPFSVIYVGARGNGTGRSTFTDPMVVIHHVTIKWHQACTGFWVEVAGYPRALLYRNNIDNDAAIVGEVNSSGPTIDCVAQDPTLAWQESSVYGADDTDGNHALYVETNRVVKAAGTIDMTSGCKAVLRYNNLTDAAFADHGHDSGRSDRHWEVYNNHFRCGPDKWGTSGWWTGRGGSGIIADNVAPNNCWSTSIPTFGATVRVLRTAQAYVPFHTTGTLTSGSPVVTSMGSTTGFIGAHVSTDPTDDGQGQEVFSGTWTSQYSNQQTNTGKIPGGTRVLSVDSSTQITMTANATDSVTTTIMAASCYPGPYPWPQQWGWGWDGVGDQFSSALEPVYVSGNKNTTGGTPGEADTVTPNDPSGFGCAFDNSGQVSSAYVQQNREWYATAKPGYTKYAYPHVLATETGASGNAPVGFNGRVSVKGDVLVR